MTPELKLFPRLYTFYLLQQGAGKGTVSGMSDNVPGTESKSLGQTFQGALV